MSDRVPNGDVAAAIQSTKELMQPTIHPIGMVGPEEFKVIVTPDGMTVTNVEEYLERFRPTPRRAHGVSTHVTLESFIAHVNRHKHNNSVIFANGDAAKPELTAVYNYNEGTGKGSLQWPHFGDHRAVYRFPLAEEWAAWNGVSGCQMSQRDFAAFIENRVLDLLPSPAQSDDANKPILELLTKLGGTLAEPNKMLELSKGLSVRVDMKVKQAINLSSGEGQISYEETHNNGADPTRPLEVPSLFLVGLPVFKGGMVYRIPARLRYRLKEGLVIWSFDLHRPDRCFEDAYNEAAQAAARETDLVLFNGAPESPLQLGSR